MQKTIFAPKAHLHSSAKVRYLDFGVSAHSTDGHKLQSDRMSGRPAPQTASTAPQPCPTPTHTFFSGFQNFQNWKFGNFRWKFSPVFPFFQMFQNSLKISCRRLANLENLGEKKEKPRLEIFSNFQNFQFWKLISKSKRYALVAAVVLLVLPPSHHHRFVVTSPVTVPIVRSLASRQ